VGRALWVVVFLAAFSALVATLPARAASAKDLGGTWHGVWTADGEWVYEADMVLSVDAENNVTGSIHWTLRKSPRAAEQAKIGLTGVEYVKGLFLPDAGVVKLEGVSLDDPNHILGMDKYRLLLSDDATILGGITWHHGPWTAQFILKKK